MSLNREDLNAELERFPTKEYLHAELERFATKEFLRAELERYATKDDFVALREEMAQGFADLRRYMEILIDDVKSNSRLVIEILSARMDAMDARTSTGLAGHERRIGGLETRVTVLEHPRRRR